MPMKKLTGGQRLLLALGLSSLTSIFFYLIGLVYYQSSIFWFLNWNLVLAWLPLLMAIWLVNWLKTNRWLSWQAVVLTVLWLGFLPNSFYIISDLMHLNAIFTTQPLFFAAMIFSFSFNGLMLGFISLYLVHNELLKRYKLEVAHSLAAAVILLCSFAVYMGRYLRWSTWDIIVNPAGVLFDVSDRFIHPITYGQTFQVTAFFFVLLGSMYFVLWNMVLAIRQYKTK